MRYCRMLDLFDDPQSIAEYERWHTQVPEPVQRHLQEQGVLSLEIYRLGHRLCMWLETDDSRFDPHAMARAEAENPALAQWEALMWRFQRPTPWTPAGQKWADAQPLYAFVSPMAPLASDS